jgi:hypothetical protein
MIEVETIEGKLVAMARAKMHSADIVPENRSMVVAHANDMVLV